MLFYKRWHAACPRVKRLQRMRLRRDALRTILPTPQSHTPSDHGEPQKKNLTDSSTSPRRTMENHIDSDGVIDSPMVPELRLGMPKNPVRSRSRSECPRTRSPPPCLFEDVVVAFLASTMSDGGGGGLAPSLSTMQPLSSNVRLPSLSQSTSNPSGSSISTS